MRTNIEAQESKQLDEKVLFERLYITYKERIFRTAYRITGNEEEAKDVMQDVFLKVFTKLKEFRHQSSLSTWIYRIAVNTSIKRATTKERHTALEKKAGMKMTTENISNDVTPILSHLSPLLRATMTLRYNEDLSYQEIAEVLDIPIGTVKSRLNNAYQHLKEILGHGLQQI